MRSKKTKDEEIKIKPQSTCFNIVSFLNKDGFRVLIKTMETSESIIVTSELSLLCSLSLLLLLLLWCPAVL